MASIVNIADFASQRRRKASPAAYSVVDFPYGLPVKTAAEPSLKDEIRSVNDDLRDRMARAVTGGGANVGAAE